MSPDLPNKLALAPLLELQGLRVTFPYSTGRLAVVDGVGLRIGPGETLSLVGESGSGKSLTARSILGLIPRAARVSADRMLFQGQNLLALPPGGLDRLRGASLGFIPQEPLSSLDPVQTVGSQVAESLRIHRGLSGRAAWARAISLMERVGIPRAAARAREYPHQFSGGQRQRLLIAAAIACEPGLLIADEPTTALDVSVQQEILELLRALQRDMGMALLLITHDMGVVAEMADRCAVMYAGQIVEEAPTHMLFESPRHPYTRALLDATPRLDAREGLRPIPGAVPLPQQMPGGCRFAPRCPYVDDLCKAPIALAASGDGRAVRCVHPLAGSAPAAMAQTMLTEASPPSGITPLLELIDVRKLYPARGATDGGSEVVALDGVSLAVQEGEALGLVGESGCGKSTTGRIALRLLPPSSGQVRFRGQSVLGLAGSGLTQFRREAQIVFQDPYGSLDPKQTVGAIVSEPLVVHGLASRKVARDRVAELLQTVGLAPEHAARYPHEFSGGQRQRIGIARALATSPRFLVADEPVSSLDVSVQAQIIALFQELRERFGLALLFISHNLSVVRQLCDRVAVMLQGRIVEMAPAEELYAHPLHPYTRHLLASVPLPDPDRPSLLPEALADTGPWEVGAALHEQTPGHWVADGFAAKRRRS